MRNVFKLKDFRNYSCGRLYHLGNVFDLADLPVFSNWRISHPNVCSPTEVRLIKRMRDVKFNLSKKKMSRKSFCLPFTSMHFQFSEAITKMTTKFYALDKRIPTTDNTFIKHDMEVHDLVKSMMDTEIRESMESIKRNLEQKYQNFKENTFNVLKKRLKIAKRIQRSIEAKKKTRKVFFVFANDRVKSSLKRLIVEDLSSLVRILEFCEDIDLLMNLSPSCSFFHTFVQERVKINFYIPRRFLVHSSFNINRTLSTYNISGLFFSSFDANIIHCTENEKKSHHHHNILSLPDFYRMKQLIISKKQYLRHIHFDHLDGIQNLNLSINNGDLIDVILSCEHLESLTLRNISKPLNEISSKLGFLKHLEFSIENILCDPKDYYYEDYFKSPTTSSSTTLSSSSCFSCLVRLNCIYRYNEYKNEEAKLWKYISPKWMRIKHEFNKSLINLKHLKYLTTNFLGLFEWDENIIQNIFQRIPYVCFHRMTGGTNSNDLDGKVFYPFEYEHVIQNIHSYQKKFFKYINLLFAPYGHQKDKKFSKRRRRYIRFIYSPQNCVSINHHLFIELQTLLFYNSLSSAEDIEFRIDVSSEYQDYVGSSILTSHLFDRISFLSKSNHHHHHHRKYITSSSTTSKRRKIKKIVYFDCQFMNEKKFFMGQVNQYKKLFHYFNIQKLVIETPYSNDNNNNNYSSSSSFYRSNNFFGLEDSIGLKNTNFVKKKKTKCFSKFILQEVIRKSKSLKNVILVINSEYYMGIVYDVLDIVNARKKSLESLIIRNDEYRRQQRKEREKKTRMSYEILMNLKTEETGKDKKEERDHKDVVIVPLSVKERMRKGLDQNVYLKRFVMEGISF